MLTDAEIERFLAEPRFGILTTNRSDGWPIGVPVWFEWDGSVVRMFSSARAPKVRRLAADPRASLLIVNHVDEPETWVAFDGEVTIRNEDHEGALELALRLAPRYWDLDDPRSRSFLDAWRSGDQPLCTLELRPQRIRSFRD